MAIRQKKKFEIEQPCRHNDFRDSFDIIIAASEDFELIRKCLIKLKKNNFRNVYLCMDGGAKDDVENLIREFPGVTILFNEERRGKIMSQMNCLKVSHSSNILLLDADIELLDNEINDFLNYFMVLDCDFLCPYSIGSYSTNTLLSKIAESDRHMRQRIVRAGRDAFSVSNLSGYCMAAKKEKYLEIIDANAIQDDVAATINLLKHNMKVKTYHRTVCSEIERMKFKSYILQKTRWTAGNILLIPSYGKLFVRVPFEQSFAFTSSFLLWYWSQWIDFISFILAFIFPPIFVVLLTEGLLKYYGLRAVRQPLEKSNYFLYILAWPVISIICLMLSPYYIFGLISEKSTRR